ncbi:fibronectin type III domain-containing protein [Campylobacter troglodytis]|uniref:fibronectin type III domain-containing protein n=1 Tax=Campylobacter troglodytis TaxID=654363 RepID=UPI001158ACAF|nr:fibronectin type III domain-containing protein [Campylobacter troglodytis]TQR60311.1 ferrous iron transporter A [Campylobacter troglodytis]
MKNFHLIIFSTLLTLFLNACGGMGKLSNKPLQVSENLPRIENIKQLSDMSSVAFEWDRKYSENIEGFFLYRSTEDEPEMKLIATIKDKYQTHYVDKNLEPDSKYFYMMKSYDELGYISENGLVVEARTAKRIAPLPFVQSIQGLPYRIKLIWRPHPDQRVSAYVIERANADGDFKFLAELKSRLNAEYIDANLKPNQNFQYRIFAKTFDGVYSEASEILNATTKALPPTVEQISASTDLPKRIALSWEVPSFEDFAYFKVYANSSSFLPYSVIAKIPNNHYEDLIDTPNQSRSYKVTIVDKDGLESPMPKNAVVGRTLGAPKAPTIISANLSSNGLRLEWISNDERAVQYTLKRYTGKSELIFTELSGTSFTDTSVIFGEKYSYELIAIDENGIESKPSAKITQIIFTEQSGF